MDLKFMQDLHNKEFETKEKLAQRASTIIAGITTLGGVLGFVAMNSTGGDLPMERLLWLVVALSGGALIVASWHLITSYRVPALNDIATPREWLEYWNDLRRQADAGDIESAESEFNSYLISQYAELGDGNIRANFQRGTRLVSSNNYVLASFVLVVLTALVFYFNNYVVASPQGEVLKGTVTMHDPQNTLICVPAGSLSSVGGGGGPKPRPVPIPVPPPRPDV